VRHARLQSLHQWAESLGQAAHACFCCRVTTQVIFETPVIPAHAGIQAVNLIVFKGNQPYELDSGFRRNECAREGAISAW
jgi:hypothetical protein